MGAAIVDLDEARQVAAAITREVIIPLAPSIDQDARWPEEGMNALVSAGLAGLAVPVEYGGSGLGAVGLAHVCEIIGRGCATTAMCFGMHQVAAATIAVQPTQRQIGEFLRPICAGEHITTLALSEPGTGAHFWLPETELLQSSNGFTVKGNKSFVTNAGHVDSYVVSTVSRGENGYGDFSCVVVPSAASGLSLTGRWEGLGMRGNSSVGVQFDDVLIGEEQLLGRVGDELDYVFGVIAPMFLIAMSGTYCGVARAALDHTIQHVRARSHTHNARTLADSPIVQHRIGTMWAAIERARHLALHAARATDSGADDALPSLCAAKAEVADTVVDVCNEAMTLCGGIAYREGTALDRHLRDARAAHVMSPTTDLLRTWTGRAALERPILAEL